MRLIVMLAVPTPKYNQLGDLQLILKFQCSVL